MIDKITDVFNKNNVTGCFVTKDLKSDKTIIYNPKKAFKRLRPASSFKIFNSLVALELNLVTPEEVINWDFSQTWDDSQKRPLNLYEAFKCSAVWFYRILAKRIGAKNYDNFLSICEYGNCETGSNADKFWVKGPLLISPIEQLSFLEKLKTNKLPFSQKNIEIVVNMMFNDSDPLYGKLYGKTGFIDETENYGWFIGWAENSEAERMFVTLLDIPDVSILSKRVEVTKEILNLMN